jgi:hypothetical protein
MIYRDYEQFKLAMQLWDRERQLFEQNETARLAQVEKAAKELGFFSSLGCIGSLIVAIVVGYSYGAAAGWESLIPSMIVGGLIASAEEKFRKWRHKDLFIRRSFNQAEPVYQPSQEPPPRPQEPPPPHTEESVLRISSMRQAYEVLGLPAGRISLAAARIAYRARIAEYHPDKVAHLGQELRELAARKALTINLALQYLEEHSKRRPQ